jgi:hypothetical protein
MQAHRDLQHGHVDLRPRRRLAQGLQRQNRVLTRQGKGAARLAMPRPAPIGLPLLHPAPHPHRAQPPNPHPHSGRSAALSPMAGETPAAAHAGSGAVGQRLTDTVAAARQRHARLTLASSLPRCAAHPLPLAAALSPAGPPTSAAAAPAAGCARRTRPPAPSTPRPPPKAAASPALSALPATCAERCGLGLRDRGARGRAVGCCVAGEACANTTPQHPRRQVPDGCGGSIACGECPAGKFCSLSGKECISSCVPATFCDSGRVCGTQVRLRRATEAVVSWGLHRPPPRGGSLCRHSALHPVPPAWLSPPSPQQANGCGGEILCGAPCPASSTCAVNGTACVAAPPTCTPLAACPAGKVCGVASDGCGELGGCAALSAQA